MSTTSRKRWESAFLQIRRRQDEVYKENFFDVQIHCQSIILPAHRYVLSSRCLFLAKQLASGVAKLNWTEFEEPTCIALLRWIYTNKVAFSSSINVTVEQWQDLLLASYKLELVSLFTVCEGKLLILLDNGSLRRSGRFRRLYGISKKVGANQLMQKCLELRLNVPDVPPEEPEENLVSLEELEAKIAQFRADSDCSGSEKSLDEYDHVTDEEFEELLFINKCTFGYDKFRQFSDMDVIANDHVWRVHAHVLGNRSETIVEKLKAANGHFKLFFGFSGFEHALLRWIYTDRIVFKNNRSLAGLLEASQFYELPALFGRCENALVGQVDIHSCAFYHQMAVKRNASKLLKRCIEVIAKYFDTTQSPDRSQMDYKLKFDDSLDSMHEMMVSESPTEAVEGLLTLNDDCLLHIFRFVSVTDLGSIKDTCKRLRPLADQSFRLRKNKSLEFNCRTMFADIWTLTHFGKFIKSLCVVSVYERYASLGRILELVAECTGEDLKSIAFHDCGEEKRDTFDCLETVLKKVECIELQWFHNDRILNSILGVCENLKEVCVGGDGVDLNSDWCVKNPNVTKLTLTCLVDDSILEEICKILTRLESLSLECTETHTNKIFHLGQLSHLKKLKVESSMIGEALQKFTDKTVLEELTLVNTQLTGSLANVLGEFANLSNLVFESCEHFDDNVQRILSEKLINIKTMTFDTCEQITSNAIMKIIRNLLHLKSISVTDCRKVEFIDRDDYLRLVKTRNLQILLDDDVHRRSCELIGNNLSSYVQVKRNQ